MGQIMDEVHMPTVPSGPTSSAYANGVSKDQLTLKQLMDERDRVQAELFALGSVLESVSRPHRPEDV